MANIIKFFVVLALSVLAGCTRTPAPEAANLLQPGKYTVVNYWAQWCKPCREEIPELNALAANYPDKVQVFGINFDGLTGEKLHAANAEFGIAYASASLQDGAELGIDRPQALPTTVIFDGNGNRLASLIGPQTLESLAAYLN